ncbi:hypothetical protein GGI12_002375 [Dipsacomyces acuminosporus]|nr:hypothetical protein GGI12_002375 [Dipsacomyces acuminosporus]
MPNEPYYYERKNGITTWIRPFDYIEPLEAPLLVGERWREEEIERQRLRAREKARRDKPKSQTKINGTEWRRVETEQGRVFYYNESTKVSRWDQPKELDQALKDIGEKKEVDVDEQNDGGDGMEGTEMNADDAEWMLAQMIQGEEEEEQDEAMGQDTHSLGYENDTQLSNAQNEQLSRDECMSKFRDMLVEAGINPFGTWDTELSKFEQDPRLPLIENTAERNDIFDLVCKELVALKRQQQKQQQSSAGQGRPGSRKPAVDPFDQLLEEVVKTKMSFAKFCQQNRKDPRFLKLRSSREREKRFIKHLESL